MGTVRYTVIDGEVLSENRNGTKRDYVPDPLGSTRESVAQTEHQESSIKKTQDKISGN